MEQKKKVRLSDIAEKLNISTVTVSKALSNKEGVGDELRRQIKEVAEQMGYQLKKTALPANSGNITGNIGILIPSRFFSRDFSYYWYLFNFLSKELLNQNYYSILELLSDEDETDLKLPRMLQDSKVDGLIILGQTNEAYVDAVKNHYDNFILLDFYTNNMHLDSVSNDDYYCTYMLTNHVISKGHKKLQFVGNFEATTSISDRFMGFQKAMLENRLSVDFNEIIPDRDEKGLKIEIPLPYENLPTAFICNCDETASTVIKQLEAKGIKVPEQVSVTGFDNYLPHGNPSVELTTVFIRPEDISKTATDLIVSKIQNKPYIKGHHLVSGNVVIRESVKDINL